MTWTRLAVLGLTTIGGVIAYRRIPIGSRQRMTRALGDRMARQMIEHMGRMIASLPESAPPKLVVSVLPRLQAQNEQIIAILREQNELLRHGR